MTTDTPFTTSDDGSRLETTVSFNADAPLTLSASNASGRVAVTTDASLPAGTIRVQATRTDHSPFEEDDHHFTVKADGNEISIHPDWQFASGVSGLARRIRDQLQHGFRPEDWNLSRLRLSPELDFHIAVTLPGALAEGSQIKLRTASGEVEARAIAANTSVVTASGDVDVRDVTGTVAIHTASGDVEATGITESLEINTASGDVAIIGGDAWLAARSASGDVAIRGMQLRNSRLTTVSGDIHMQAVVNNTANYGIETVSGDVSLDLTLPAQGCRATLGFGTLSGSSDIGAAWDKQKRREWTAGEGDRGPTINVKTVSGDLGARARLDAGVTARSMEMPRSAPAEEDIDGMYDFKHEMKHFGKEMKQLGKEMQHMGHSMGHVPPVTPPTLPTPPTPPVPHHDERAREQERRLMEREQRLLEREQRLQEREGERQRRRDEQQERRNERQERRDESQRLRDLDQRLRDEERRRQDAEATGIFTAGPSGVDFRNVTPPAQQTEPVVPPAPFTEETDTVSGTDTGTTPSKPQEPASGTSRDERLRVLEALEKGEIDIEDALAQLESDPNQNAEPGR
jgi:hypothetical protein